MKKVLLSVLILLGAAKLHAVDAVCFAGAGCPDGVNQVTPIVGSTIPNIGAIQFVDGTTQYTAAGSGILTTSNTFSGANVFSGSVTVNNLLVANSGFYALDRSTFNGSVFVSSGIDGYPQLATDNIFQGGNSFNPRVNFTGDGPYYVFSSTVLPIIDQSTRSATSATQTGSGNSWDDPNRAITSDGSYADPGTVGITKTIQATAFGFSIPSSHTVMGIKVFEGRTSHPNHAATSVISRLIKNGVITGYNYSWQNITQDFTNGGATTVSTTTFGGIRDTFGVSLTPADVNSPNFGYACAINVTNATGGTGFYDFIKMDVYTTTTNYSVAMDSMTDYSLKFSSNEYVPGGSATFSIHPTSVTTIVGRTRVNVASGGVKIGTGTPNSALDIEGGSITVRGLGAAIGINGLALNVSSGMCGVSNLDAYTMLWATGTVPTSGTVAVQFSGFGVTSVVPAVVSVSGGSLVSGVEFAACAPNQVAISSVGVTNMSAVGANNFIVGVLGRK